jgi:hypothetical protein
MAHLICALRVEYSKRFPSAAILHNIGLARHIDVRGGGNQDGEIQDGNVPSVLVF